MTEKGRTPGRAFGAAWPRLAFLALTIVCVLAAAGCSVYSRREAVFSLAADLGLQAVSFDTGGFILQGFWRGAGAVGSDLTVYIEGDGRSWTRRWKPARDPSPATLTVLQMSARDSSAKVLYLARPCHFTTSETQGLCDTPYWTSHRFAPEVVDAVDQAIEQAKGMAGAEHVRLIGYSGGGVVAALVAARRNDVSVLGTVAAPLDTAAWTQWHKVSPLVGSLTPMDELDRLRRVPQIHFVGSDDEVVPAGIVRSYVSALSVTGGDPLVIVPDVEHQDGWVGRWADLQPLVSRAAGRVSDAYPAPHLDGVADARGR